MWERSLLTEGSDTMGADMIYGRELHLSRKEADGCGHLLNISIFLSCGSHKFSMSKVELIIFLRNFFLSLTSLALQKAPTPLLAQYSCPENSIDRRVWQTTVLGVAKSWTWLIFTSLHSVSHSGSKLESSLSTPFSLYTMFHLQKILKTHRNNMQEIQ